MRAKLFLTVLLVVFLHVNIGAVELVIHEDLKSETMKFDDDYVYLGQKLVFSGEAEDIIFLGENLDFTGKTKLGMFALGEGILINGTIGNGIAAAGENISIKGDVKGTNFIAGRRIVIEKETSIEGSIFVGSAELIIRGKVNGDVYVGAGKVTVENTINGNINAHTGRLMILNDGKINGNLNYTSDKELSQEELSKISGKVEFEKKEHSKMKHLFKKTGIWKVPYLIKLFFLVSFLISGLLFLFLPPTKVLETPRSGDKFWFTSLYGLIPLFMYPAIVVLSALLVITLPLTGLLLLAILPLSFVTKTLGITLLGQYLSGLFKIEKVNRFLYFLVGMVCAALVNFIPFLNFIFSIFIASLGFGLIISHMFKLKTA